MGQARLGASGALRRYSECGDVEVAKVGGAVSRGVLITEHSALQQAA